MPISDYLRTLREKVGQDPILMPSASTVVRDDHGRLLLARHSDGDLWVLPGGALDPGESPADTAIRETWEETGLLESLKFEKGKHSPLVGWAADGFPIYALYGHAEPKNADSEIKELKSSYRIKTGNRPQGPGSRFLPRENRTLARLG